MAYMMAFSCVTPVSVMSSYPVIDNLCPKQELSRQEALSSSRHTGIAHMVGKERDSMCGGLFCSRTTYKDLSQMPPLLAWGYLDGQTA